MPNRKIALVGAAPSRDLAVVKDDEGNPKRVLPPEWELWTINRMVSDGILLPEHVDRLIDIHWLWFIKSEWYDYGESYTAWLEQEHPFDLYMQEAYPEVPSAVKYPLNEILDKIFANFYVGDVHARYLTSSFSYNLALAILEHLNGDTVDEILIAGYEMPWDSEWMYQRPGATFLTGFAGASGMTIRSKEGVDLYNAYLYGYEVAEMIPRQTLVEHRRFHQLNIDKYSEKLKGFDEQAESLKDRFIELKGDGDEVSDPHLTILEKQLGMIKEKWNRNFAEMHRAEAVVDFCNKMIEKCDLQNVKGEGMIPRQHFEEYKIFHSHNFSESTAKLNGIEGDGHRLENLFTYNIENGRPKDELDWIKEEVEEMKKEWTLAFANMHRAEATLQFCEKMIKTCDLQEVPMELMQGVGRLEKPERKDGKQ